MNDSNILLNEEKQNHFQKLINNRLSDKGYELKVTVRSDGYIFINKIGMDFGDIDEDKIYSEIEDINFEFRSSPYNLTRNERISAVGVSYKLTRDGW